MIKDMTDLEIGNIFGGCTKCAGKGIVIFGITTYCGLAISSIIAGGVCLGDGSSTDPYWLSIYHQAGIGLVLGGGALLCIPFVYSVFKGGGCAGTPTPTYTVTKTPYN